MKKYISVILICVMSLYMAGCGAKSETSEPNTEPAVTEESGSEEDVVESSSEESETAEEQVFEGTEVKTDYFSFVYGDGWECDEENDIYNYDGGCTVSAKMPDPESNSSKVKVTMEVSQNDAYDFAENLFDHGMNAEDAITGNNDYTVRKIGGIDCFTVKEGNSAYYYGCIPDENTFIEVTVYSDESPELADPVLDSIKLNAPSWEKDTIPWYWEGTPYSVDERNTTVGSFTVNSKQIPLDAVGPCFEIFLSRIQAVGNDYYIANDYKLKKYVREGDTLKYDSDIELPFEVREYSVGADGTIYASNFMDGFCKIQNGTETQISDDTDYVILDPTCTWGISYFNGPDVAKINVSDGAITNHTLEGVAIVSRVMVTDNYIIVQATMDDADRTSCLIIYDHDFNKLTTLDKTSTTTDYYGSVSAATETANGLVIFDGNMRDVYFLDTNLSLITAVDMPVLMGTYYPWPCQAITLEDGSVMVICTDKRADKSCDESVVFQLTGF